MLEFFDADSSIRWWQIYQQGCVGSPIGCDANASQNGSDPVNAPDAGVTASDIICTVLVFFGAAGCTTDDACTTGGVQTAGIAAPAVLHVASVGAEAGKSVDVPISLEDGGNAIAAAGFTIEYEAAALGFDTSDPDGDELLIDLMLLPAQGSATVNTDGTVIYLPKADFSDSFTCTASDGRGGALSANVNIVTQPVYLPLVRR